MIYDEFLNFLDKFEEIRSFSGKIRYANTYLSKIGSGSGRVVYDIDETKVFKIAKNPKGIAQNEAEIDASSYSYNQYIITKVFDSDNNSSWIIAERGKKVNEKRIKELTGISGLFILRTYLQIHNDLSHGKNSWLSLDENISEQLDENEWVQLLVDFIDNNASSYGDMGRPSTYGEVIRNGKPEIVLTDYGLSDEVYTTHYMYKPKPTKYGMYELYNFGDGNDDLLSDIGNVGNEVRHGMWAIMPYSVSDGDDVVNLAEHKLNFIENNNKYPKEPIENIGYLTDVFHECVNGIKPIMKQVKNKRKFYENLLKLQEYLIEQHQYDREPLPDLIDEGLDKANTDNVADFVAKKFNLGEPKYIDGGYSGNAYEVGDKVIKVTSDHTEAYENLKLIGKNLKYIAEPYNVFELSPKSGSTMPKNYKKIFVIILEKLKTDAPYFESMYGRLEYIANLLFGEDTNHYELLTTYQENKDVYKNQYEEKINKYLSKNPEDAKFYYNLLKIIDELNEYGIESTDYHFNNLGYKPSGVIGFFDIGYGNYNSKPISQPEKLTVAEDSTALYSTDSDVGSMGFPTYANGYYGGDTDIEDVDKHYVNERMMSVMPGAQSVEVKKECRLGGLGHTSKQCNWGDMNNLKLKPINENRDIPTHKTFWAWVDPDNNLIIVPELKHHQFIKSKYPKFGGDLEELFTLAFKDGWVRVVNEYDTTLYSATLSINGYDKKRIDDILKNFFFDTIKYGDNRIYLDSENPPKSEVFNTGNAIGKMKLYDYLGIGVTENLDETKRIKKSPEEMSVEDNPKTNEYWYDEKDLPKNLKDRLDTGNKPTSANDKLINDTKKFLGYDPHGVKVFLVSGELVRKYLDGDWTQGGNDMAYPVFTPKNEIWLDDDTVGMDRVTSLVHESTERYIMFTTGKLYFVNDKVGAHVDALDAEKKIRNGEIQPFKLTPNDPNEDNKSDNNNINEVDGDVSIEKQKSDYWNSPTDNIYLQGKTNGWVVENWLERHKIPKEDNLYVFYHGTPKIGGAKDYLKKGSLLANKLEDANFFARRDRDLKEDDINVIKVLVSKYDIFPGVFASLRVDIPIMGGNIAKTNTLNENVDPYEWNNPKFIQSVLNGSRNIGYITLTTDDMIDKLISRGLNVLSTSGTSAENKINPNQAIIFRDEAEDQALKLYDVLQKQQGFLTDNTPEEARYIGELLGYTDEAIKRYINQRYNHKEYKSALTEGILNEDDLNNLKSLPGKEHLGWISKDNKFIDVNSHLELLRKLYPDEPSTENHTDVVDTIGTDEEIDNLYRQAFKDGWVRIDYHNYQRGKNCNRIGPTLSIEGLNKDRLIDIIQNIYYPYIKNGGRIFADFNNNWKKFTLPEDKDKLMQFMFGNGYEENLNENIIKEDTTTDLKSLPNREHTGWILPDNTFVSVKNHLDYLKKIYPEEFSKKIGEKNNAYIKAYEAGFVRLWFEIHNSGPELAIDGINKNRIIEILENIYYPYFNGKSGKIYVDITDIKDNNYHNHKSYRFGLPEDKDRLMQFMFGNGNEPDNDSYLEENESIDEEIEKEYGDSMAKFVANKLNLGTVEHLGGACFGQAYDVGDNKVLKITSDKSEAYNNMKLIGKDLKYIAEPYNVFELAPKLHSISRRSWVIILEKLTTDADYFYGMFDRMKDYSKKLTNYDVSYPPRSYYNSSDVYNNEYRSKIESYLVDYPDDANFYYNIMAIADELKKYGINSEDFCNSGNLGFKGDNIAYFDLGCGSSNNPDLDKELKSKSIPIDENNINEAFENLKNLPGKPTRGWILPDNKFEELNLHLSYLVKQYPELSNDWDALYNQAYSDGLIRIDFTTDSHGKYSLNIDGWNLERIKDIIENIYYPYLSNISADIFVDTANYSYTFNLPKDKMKLNFFLFGGEFEDDEYLGENKKNIVNKKKNINFADSNQSSDILSESTNTDAFVNNIKQKSFIQAIFSMGGDCYLIGGVPRDLVLGKPNKDIDLIVSKINFEKLMQLLRRFGSADMVGKSFGVIKFRDNSDGEEYDIALPREDTKNNIGGHKGFDVKYDENLPIEKDLTRRDCRFNAMAINLKSDEFIDPLGGMEDIKNKTITMVSPEAFAEDPLRLLRLIQFAARFNFTIEPNTLNTIKENAERIKEITPDRILEELNKIVNKNGNKQYGVELLVETGLFKNIFGKDIEPSRIERRDFDHVKTLAEYIFLMSYGVVDNCAEFFKNSLTGDNDSYNMIRALEIAFNADLSNQAMTNVEARSIAHNMYLVSPESLKSEILPETIENACKELLSGKYPKLVTELTINGNDLMAIGLKGKAIGDMLKSLLIKIYADKLHNNKEELLSAVKEKPINNEGVADVYAEKQFGIPNPNTEFEKNYQDLQKIQKQKNIEKPFGYVDDDVPVYKNPKSLENFSDDNVRAIGDKNGNLYVAVLDGNFVHGKMGYEAGIVSSSMRVYDLNYFVGLHRIGDSNDFGLSDSTESEFQGSDGQINRKKVIDMLHKIKQKNPQYNFYLEYYGDGTLCDDNKVNENNIK